MQAAVVNSDSKSDFKLLLQLAKKLDIQTKILSNEDIEDIGLVNAIRIGETGENVDVAKYLKNLTK
jgi:hypothetical protein